MCWWNGYFLLVITVAINHREKVSCSRYIMRWKETSNIIKNRIILYTSISIGRDNHSALWNAFISHSKVSLVHILLKSSCRIYCSCLFDMNFLDSAFTKGNEDKENIWIAVSKSTHRFFLRRRSGIIIKHGINILRLQMEILIEWKS